MGSCEERCVYRANSSGEKDSPDTGHREVWCAKLARWVEMNDNPCLYFRPREGGNDRY